MKKSGWNKWWIVSLAALLIMSLTACGTTGAKKAAEVLSSQVIPQLEEVIAGEAEPEDDVPTEFKNARRQAEQYASLMHMSRQGIYDQLTSEYGGQFPAEVAQYAMDSLDWDWNANALAKAEDYSKTMHMSKAGIYDQLISEYGEKFTEEEARYAIENVEADWNENALAKAKDYQQTMSMSNAAIYDQLTSEYGEKFTAEEAQYAVDHLE